MSTLRSTFALATWMPVLAGLLFGGLMLLGGPPVLMLGVVAVMVAVAILTRPVRGFLLFCLIAPFVPWTTVTIGIRVTVSEALLALTWGGIFWQRLMGRMPPRQKGPTERAMLRFMAWTIVPLIAGQFMVHEEGNGPVNWLRWLLNISTLFLVPVLITTEVLRKRMMDCLLLGFTAMLALSLGLFIKSPDARSMIPVLSSLHYAHPEALLDIFTAMANRMASPWVHPNSTGGALLLGVPLAMFYGVTQAGWRRGLSLFVALGGAAGIVFSGSRGALLSLTVLVIWLAYRRVPMAGRALLIGALLSATMLIAYPPARERLASLSQGSQDASTSVRFDEYKNFHRAVERYPLGLGFKVDTPATGGGVFGISNLWLNYWYKLGLPGMLFFIAVTMAWWREVRQLGDLSKMNAGNAMHVGSVGAMLAALMTGFIDHYFSFTQVLISLFWLTMAISLQASRPLPAPAEPAAGQART